MQRLLIIILCMVPILSIADTTESQTPTLTVYLDKGSAGWTFKLSDYAYQVKQGDCIIQWNAVEGKDSEHTLELHEECGLPFSQKLALHRTALKAIHSKKAISEYKSIYLKGLCDNKDWSWCIPIAKASLKSPAYADYQRHYPKSILTNLNQHFVELANQTQSYRPFYNLFREFDADITLTSVEKVFALRFKELPFYNELKHLNVEGNPRAMYDVGMAFFGIQ